MKDALHYDADTGVFTWITSPANNVKAGSIAGAIDTWGHRQIRYKGVVYPAHQLAWFFVNGIWPASLIDHRDGDKDNNRITNLRLATNAQNTQNARRRADNTSGYKGVYRKGSGWQAYVSCNGVRCWLGVFETAALAHEFRSLAADLLHGEFANHG